MLKNSQILSQRGATDERISDPEALAADVLQVLISEGGKVAWTYLVGHLRSGHDQQAKPLSRRWSIRGAGWGMALLEAFLEEQGFTVQTERRGRARSVYVSL